MRKSKQERVAPSSSSSSSSASSHPSSWILGSIVGKEDASSTSAILWMSEAAMASASLRSSYLVSVSVVTSGSYSNFNLESLERLCSKSFGITVEDCMEEPGTFCALAVAWPCRKLKKDGLRLSRQLANSLGCPDIGANILVRPVSILDKDVELKNVKLSVDSNRDIVEGVVQDCKHVDLRLYPVESSAGCKKLPSISNGSSVVAMPSSVQPTAIKQQSTLCSGSGNAKPSCIGKDCGQMVTNIFSASSILDQQSSKGREILETYASRFLCGRFLLKGNFVTIPICGRLCIFRVLEAEGFKNMPMQISANNSAKATGSNHSERLTIFLTGIKTTVGLHLALPVVPCLGDDLRPQSESREQVMQNEMTKVEISGRVEFSALGGLSEQIAALKEIIELSLKHPELLLRLGLQPTRGVILYGPPGTGKTSLAFASACEAGINIFSINGPEIVNEYYGESEQALCAVFTSAKKAAPSMVFIDELDSIAPQRQEGVEGLTQRIVATLLTLMDGGIDDSHHGVLVIAATNRLDTIDPALRRPGRFDREIEIGVPSPSGRCEILNTFLCRMKHALTSENIRSLAHSTHGFVGADLMALCNEAAMVALQRYVSSDLSFMDPLGADEIQMVQQFRELDLSKKTSASTEIQNDCKYIGIDEEKLRINMGDFEEAKSKVRPSAMREVMLEIPQVHWSDVGGQDDVKQQLREAVEWPQKHGDAFMRIGVSPPRGVLLFGPPGCSKTLMARAVATEAGLNFMSVKGPELFSKWVGESEKAVQALFERARTATPCIVFFDEIDGLAIARDSGHDGVSVGDRVMIQLLVEMDGLKLRNGVIVIAATNRPDSIDPALLRPGRFDRLLYVGPPDEVARQEIFEIHAGKLSCGADVSVAELAARTNGYTGADIAALCREAGMAALEESLDSDQILMRHFEAALRVVGPSHSGERDSVYSQFQRGFTKFSK